MSPFEQASVALVESLFDDPFYAAISEGFAKDQAAQKRALNLYFQYSLEEAERTGRCVLAGDPKLGAAAWLLPRSRALDQLESAAKWKYLETVLGSRGVENYKRIVGFMAPLASRVVPQNAWYLSIVGVLPAAQGRGLGAELLSGTLKEAECVGVTCYLETFTPRSLRFYERLGFRRAAQHLEPTTSREYVILRKDS